MRQATLLNLGLDPRVFAEASPAEQAAMLDLARTKNKAARRRERQLDTLETAIKRRQARIWREYDAAVATAKERYRAAEQAAFDSARVKP